MSQAADKERWLIRLIVIKKVLLAALLLVISLAALYGDIHYAQLSDFADTWGQADRSLFAAMAQQGGTRPDALDPVCGGLRPLCAADPRCSLGHVVG